MRTRKIFKWALLGTASLAAILLLLLFTLDLGFLSKTLQTRIGSAIGRSVIIEEGLSIRLGRELVIEARGIRLANAEWAGEEDLGYLARLYAEVDLLSLWQGPSRVRHLELEGARLHLVQDASGRANWRFDVMRGERAVAEAAGLPVLIEHIDLSDAILSLQSPRLDRPLEAHIGRFEQRLDENGKIHGDLDGQVNGHEFQYSGTVETWDRLLSGSDILVDGQGHFGPATVSLAGRFDSMWPPRRPELELAIEAPSLHRLTDMLGIGGLGDGVVYMRGSTRAGPDGLAVEASLTAGALSADFRGQLAALTDLTRLTLEARARGPNFGRLARLAGYEGWPEQPFGLNARARRQGDQLTIERLNVGLAGTEAYAEGTLPAFPGLAGAELRVRVDGRQLAVFRSIAGLEALPEGPFHLGGELARLDDSQTRVALEFTTPLATGQAAGRLSSNTDFNVSLDMQGEDASQLGRLAELAAMAGKPWQLGLEVSMAYPSAYDIAGLDFTTTGLDLGLRGRMGAGSGLLGSRVEFTVSGERLADFQALAPAYLTLPAAGFRAEGSVGKDGPDWRLSGVTARIGPNEYRLSGTLGMTEDLAGTDLVVEATGSDIGRLFQLPGAARLPDGPFTASGRFTVDDGQLALDGLRLRAGTFDLGVDCDLPWPFSPAAGQCSAQLSGQDVTRILPRLAGVELDANAFELHAAGDWSQGLLRLQRGSLLIGASALTVSGTADLPPNVSATDLTISLESPDLSRLGTFRGKRWEAVPLEIDALFSGAADAFQLERLHARLGENEIAGFFEIDTQPDIPEFDLRLSTSVLDLRPFLGMPPAGATADRPGREGRLIPDFELPMAALSRVNGRFVIGVDKMLLRRTTLINNVVNGEVRDGKLTFSELGVDTFGGRLAASMALVPTPEASPRLTLGIHGDGLVLDFINVSKDDAAVLPRFDTHIDLEGAGATLREIARSLDGRFVIYSPGGTVRKLDVLSGSGQMLARLVMSISPVAAQRSEVGISCFAAVGDVKDGLVNLSPGMALQSDRLNIFANGTVDLETERLDVNFRSATRRAVDISASELFSPYVKMTGTLARPSIAIDPRGTLLSGGAAFLSGGLSILARKALDQLEGQKDPCTQFLKEAEQDERSR